MTTQLTTLKHKQTHAGNPDFDIYAVSDNKYGDVMVSVRVDFDDGTSTIATMTVTHDNVLIATGADIKKV